MRHLPILLITTILALFCTELPAQENPFMEMAGKRYAEYSRELAKFHELDTTEAQQVIRQLEEVAKKTGSVEWQLQAEFFKTSYGNDKYSLKSHRNDTLYYEKYLTAYTELLRKAEKAAIPHLELRFRQMIIDYWWSWAPVKNYELVFELYAIQIERLRDVSSDDIPEKADYYVLCANAYYSFKEYPKAIYYYNLAMEEPDNASNFYAKLHALNGLGLCYSGGGDFDRADSCFYVILQTKFLPEYEYRREEWEGIVEGHLGNNMVSRGEISHPLERQKWYAQSIPLLKSSIEKMLKFNDFAFAAGRAVDLVNVLLEIGNVEEAGYYMNLATASQFKPTLPRNTHLFYEAKCKYYLAVGNHALSKLYMDSMLTAKQQNEERFNAMLLLRMEQKETAKQQQQLAQDQEKQRQMQVRILALSVGCILIFSLLGIVFFLYRKRRAAYRALVRKSLQWAQVRTETDSAVLQPMTETDPDEWTENEQDAQDSPPDETDFSIIATIEQLMTEEKIYSDSSLSVDAIAQRLGFKRYYVSEAINRCTKKNFNTFVNEYRIKEAIRLLSGKHAPHFSIDGIASDSGFNDRRNFHRVFKKMTGLTPAEFVKGL